MTFESINTIKMSEEIAKIKIRAVASEDSRSKVSVARNCYF